MSERVVGVIGGSGLYEMEGLKNVKEVKVKTPFGNPSDAYIVGKLGDVKMVFLPRHGRGHRILPSELNFRANIYGMKRLGVEWIISVSAVGSMREDIKPGHIVVVDQFFDRTKGRGATFFGNGIVGHVEFADPVCPNLSSILYDAGQHTGATIHKGGTYICI
ncbi:MAG TPA: S-methyl-5'-thioadenosine phosphorylase, partial [Deltaproteobacteria bacterium]|nr:S-methyl-5'-thioadenosine phosphorylase [Deltaproteobacteria bacterium]